MITEPNGVDAALADPESRVQTEPLPRQLDAIVDAPPLPRNERLGIYAEGYYTRIRDCLAQDFPALHAHLESWEADAFGRVVVDYLEAYPSRYTAMDDVGGQLARFLRTHPAAEALPFLPDLAKLEWALVHSFYADDLGPLDRSRFATMTEDDWAGARIGLDTSVVLFASEWPVDTLHERRDLSPAQLAALSPDPRYLLVHRDDYAVTVESIGPARHRILSLLAEGLPLGEVFERVQNSLPEGAEPVPVMEWFADWIRAGLIRSVTPLSSAEP